MKVLRFYVLCPVALKMKNIPSVKQRKNKGKVNKQLSGCSSHLLVGKGMCHLAPSSCTTNESTSSAFWPLAKLLQKIYANIWSWQSADFMGGSRVAQLRSFVLPGHGCVCEPTLCLSLVNGAKGL